MLRILLAIFFAATTGLVDLRPAAAQAPVPDDIGALSKQVSELIQQGKFKETIAAANKGLPGLERNYGRDHLFVGAILQLQALAYQLDGQYPESVKAYLRALPIIKKGMGPKNSGVGDILTNLGLTYAKAAQNAEAERYFKEAFTFYEKVPGDGQIAASDRMFNLAGIYQSTARPVEAVTAMKRAIAIRQKVLGPAHVDIAVLTHSLGTVYLEQGRFAEAEQEMKQALSILKKVPGQAEIGVAAISYGLGKVYLAQGRPGEAEPQLKRALAIQEQAQGPDGLDVAATLRSLASLYSVTARLAEAERLMRRSLAIREKAAGPNAILAADSLLGMAEVLQASDRHEEAEAAARRALAICEKETGPDSAAVAAALDHIVSNLVVQERSREAEPLARRTLAIHEKTTGPNSLQTAEALNRLALSAYRQLRYVEAEQLYKRALAIHENVGGANSDFVAVTLAYIPSLYIMQGRFAEAEPIMLRSVAIFDRAGGSQESALGNALFFLAELYMMQGRVAEAEPIARRSLGIQEKLYGADNPKIALNLAQLAGITMRMEKLKDAEALARKALLSAEKATDSDHHTLIVCLQQLSAIYFHQERFAEAEPLVKRALADAQTRTSGTEDDKVAVLSQNLALLYSAQGRSAEAEPLYTRSLALSVKLNGPEHRSVSIALASLAGHYLQLGQLERAADFGKRSADLILRRMQRGVQTVEQGLAGAKKSEAELQTTELRTYVQILGKIEAASKSTSFPPEMFEMAQWALSSEAAQSLAQMGARSVKGDAKLAALVRERQDTVTEWQARDAARSAAIGQASGNRDARAEADNVAQLSMLDQRLIALDKRLAVEFPDYTALANPAPLSPKEVQALLKPDEALMLFLDLEKGFKPLGGETLIWVVTKTGTRWARTDMGSEVLKREVQALRCGLDADAWTGPSCAELTRGQYTEADRAARKPLPFDHGRAYALYKALFGQMEDLVGGKHLLIVPSGALTQLPFHVLVTSPPASGGDQRAAAWFARSYAHTLLPAVASLRTLRQIGRPSAATKPIIGFGNPLLDGYGPSDARRAQRARENQLCRNFAPGPIAALGLRVGMTAIPQPGGLATTALIRAQMPLPETADELCAVARDLGGAPADIRLGAHATEREVKALSKSGELMQYRVIHFATHGTLAGQLNSMEPGLILTPPDSASAEDDGYLSASEIAGLRLDADLVILSACNTAAGNASSAQALSGLARAFFYAQARTLLVSHWAIDSNATVKLVTAAMAEWKRNTGVSHAEALRRAMLALIDKGEPQEAHPAYWAPFVVVGDGAR